MFRFNEFKASGLSNPRLEPLKGDDTYTIVYFYQPDEQFFKDLNNQYQQDFSSLFFEETDAQYSVGTSINDYEYISLLLLYPKEKNETKLERMVESLLILRCENLVIVITEEKEAFVSEFLKKCSNVEATPEESMVGIVSSCLEKMAEDAHRIRDEIDALERSINENGPTHSVFNNLLQLKKYLITLSLTYDSDDKIIEFFKREKNFLNIKSKGSNSIIQLEEELDSLKKLTHSYNQYLASLDGMINNLGSFRLNTIMKTLTEISIVLTIPAMTYGFWGINVKLPFEESPIGFLFVFGISLLVSGGAWYWIRKMKFL